MKVSPEMSKVEGGTGQKGGGGSCGINSEGGEEGRQHPTPNAESNMCNVENKNWDHLNEMERRGRPERKGKERDGEEKKGKEEGGARHYLLLVCVASSFC